MKVKSFLNPNVIFCTENATALDVIRIMENESVGSIVIVNTTHNKPSGIITDRDIVLKAAIKNINLETIPVTQIMSTDLLKVKESDELENVIDSMSEKKVRRAPVVDDEGILVGIISLDDMIKMLEALLNKLSRLIEKQIG